MRYDDDIEIIDAFEDVKNVSHDNLINNSSKESTNEIVKNDKNINKTNKILLTSILLLPIFIFIFVISLHSKNLINERISVFSLIVIFLLSISFIIGIIKELKIKRNIFNRFIKLTLSSVYLSVFLVAGVFLYGSDSSLRDFIIDKAMQTKNHQFLATWLFDKNTINNSLEAIKDTTKIDLAGSKKIEFDDIKYNQKIYANKYEAELLTKKNENDLYKIIKISGKTIGANYKYKGYLVAIYDPSKVKLGVSTGAGTWNGSYGEILSDIARKNHALVAMNAGGFYDPFWNSNGGIPHGAVIKDGKVLSEFRRGLDSGGMIGFTDDNRLILKRMTSKEALDIGIRDAVDWGPYLIVNGKNQYANVKHYTWATSRTVIGQRKDGIVLMLVVDGGNQPGSFGASYADCAKIMANYGVINAANLDGGTSTALVENNNYVNNPWNGHKRTIRRLPNAWIVVK